MTHEALAVQKVKEKFPQAVVDEHAFRGDQTIIIKKEFLVPVVKCLKEDRELDFNFLMDLAGVDYLGRSPRFEVVYNIFSLAHKARLRVKVQVEEEDPEVDSLVPLWPIANWYEREVWDMFGVRFRGHPDLKRILMYEGFEGHPLRKDYPITKRQPRIGPVTDAKKG